MTRRVLELLGPSTGGIRRHVAALSDHLGASSWDALVAAPRGVMEGLVEGAAVVDLPGWRAPLQVRRLASDVQVLHAHGLKAGLFAAAARTRAPLVLTLHNVVLDEVAGRWSAPLRRLERSIVRRADRVICGSADIAEEFASIVDPSRLRSITPAAPDPVVRRDRHDVRAALGVADDDLLVVTPARLHPQKDLALLVGAFAEIAGRHPHTRLVVLGDGPLRETLQADIDARGLTDAITLAGHADNPADEMAAADLVALSSTWEAVPIVAAEALQLGRPVVMTAVGTIGTQMAVDGVGGLATAPGDRAAFARSLDALLGDAERRRELGEAGRAVGERYRAAALVAAVAAVYDEVAR